MGSASRQAKNRLTQLRYAVMKKSFYYVIDRESKANPDEIRSKLLKNRQKLDQLLQEAPTFLKSKQNSEKGPVEGMGLVFAKHLFTCSLFASLNNLHNLESNCITCN